MHESGAMQNSSIATLGRYRILQRIGRGGMGDVWLCEDPTLRRQIAIKTLPSHSETDREFALRFEREAQAAAALNHPHILPVHDYGQQPLQNGQSITYIVMPYIAGGSLADRIANCVAQRMFMPVDFALLYLMHAAKAIDHAHEQGVIHRDIKPGNMLLRTDKWLLLADFGIARILASADNLTQTGVGFGTPHYMAPEQAQGRAEFASDNYSLAVIAYQLFAGRVPFDAGNAYATTIQHMTLPPPPIRQFNRSLSPTFEAALLKGLEKQPAQRPSSARDFVATLQQALTSNAHYAPTEVKATPFPFPGMPSPQNSFPQATTVQQPFPGQTTVIENGQAKQPVTTPPNATRRRLVIGGGAAVVLAGGGLSIWTLLPKISAPPSVTPQPTSAPIVPPAANQSLVLRGHNKPVAILAWSPQGVLASAGSQGDGQVFLWDVQTLFQQKESPAKPKATQQFHTGQDILLAWSPQGDMLAIANADSGPDFNSTRLDVYTGDLGSLASGYNDKFIIKDALVVDVLSWSPSENLATIVHSSSNLDAPDALTLWDAKHPQQVLASLHTPRRAYTDVGLTLTNNPMAFAPHTQPLTLALGTHDGISVEQIDLSKLQPQIKESFLFTYGDNEKYTSSTKLVAWSSDGRYLAGIKDNYNKPTSIAIWDMQTHTILSARALPDDVSTYLLTTIWSPAAASSKIAAGANNGRVYIWDSNGNALPIDVKSPPADIQASIRALSWSADGQWLAAAYNDQNASIVIWKM
ncbi:MAG: protein kinase [Ktedonobacteraceae bacterium]|nr:protein kinase [Ktedonobacteraceae bacterium]